MVSAEDSTPQIHISLEQLRTEIRLANAELELRLQSNLASKVEVDNLNRQLIDVRHVASTADKWISQNQTSIDNLIKNQAQTEKDIEELKTNKASEEAVSNYKRWLLGGGIFITLFTI